MIELIQPVEGRMAFRGVRNISITHLTESMTAQQIVDGIADDTLELRCDGGNVAVADGGGDTIAEGSYTYEETDDGGDFIVESTGQN